jgi:hypothetical protein
MSRRYRAAIVGTGAIAAAPAEAVREHAARIELVAVTDLDAGRARAFAQTHQIPMTHSDMSLLLAAESLDLVHLCTPPSTHAPLAAACLRAGVNCSAGGSGSPRSPPAAPARWRPRTSRWPWSNSPTAPSPRSSTRSSRRARPRRCASTSSTPRSSWPISTATPTLETVAVQAAHTSSALDALAAGDGRHLRDAAVFSAPRSVTAGWGMCGRLGTHDVRNPPGRRVFLNGDAPYHRRDC